MNTNNANLNLTRKWRPKTFNKIIGQSIPIKILQNGLYLKKFFPVYLFAGQRGCGKTSSARIFAAAINCQNLKNFQENPKKQVPCLKCESCISMQKSNHPDFIEIDAASHTGVDNVRQILESCAYMPLTGNKKIYLIDEAHMLSKAAFNAFLKILEEPPSTVLFILATTEIHKIPQTVLSRCFQVIFRPINSDSLKEHLIYLSKSEKIKINETAINMIIEETEGSARDAINLLERVRFSSQQITEETVLSVLGKISEKDLIKIFESLIVGNVPKLLNHLVSINFQSLNPQIFWNTLVQTCRNLIWTKYETNIKNKNIKRLKQLANKCNINRIHAIFQLLWNQEPIFLQTSQKHIFLESILIQICEQTKLENLTKLPERVKNQNINFKANLNNTPKPLQTTTNTIQPQASSNPIASTTNNSQWNQLLRKINLTSDNVLKSFLQQAKFIKADKENKSILISLYNDNQFVRDQINDSKHSWIKLLQETFPGFEGFKFEKTQKKQTIPNQTKQNVRASTTKNIRNSSTSSYNTQNYSPQISFDISNKEKWPKANLIIKHFPGKIKLSK